MAPRDPKAVRRAGYCHGGWVGGRPRHPDKGNCSLAGSERTAGEGWGAWSPAQTQQPAPLQAPPEEVLSSTLGQVCLASFARTFYCGMLTGPPSRGVQTVGGMGGQWVDEDLGACISETCGQHHRTGTAGPATEVTESLESPRPSSQVPAAGWCPRILPNLKGMDLSSII